MFDLTQNYFQLFGLEPAFDLDLNVLNQRYRAIQAQVHPDKFVGKHDQEQRLAVQFTSFVNAAYLCLKQLLERAKYLLTLRKVEVNLDTQSHVDVDFLMTQITLREKLEALSAHKNAESGVAELNNEIDQKLAALSGIFAHAYRSDQNHLALDAVVKWQFLVKLQRDVSAFEESL